MSEDINLDPRSFAWETNQYPDLEEKLHSTLKKFNDPKYMKNVDLWNEFIREVAIDVADAKMTHEFLYDNKSDVAIARKQRDAVLKIKGHLKSLHAYTSEYLWIPVSLHYADAALEDRALLTKQLFDSCEWWLRVFDTEKTEVMRVQGDLIGRLDDLLRKYTKLSPSYSNTSHYVTFCFKVFACAFGAKYSRDDVRNRLRDILNPKK